jgi:hypothetical protein
MSKTIGNDKVKEHLQILAKCHFSSLRFELGIFEFEQAFEMRSKQCYKDICSNFYSNSVRTACFFRSFRGICSNSCSKLVRTASSNGVPECFALSLVLSQVRTEGVLMLSQEVGSNSHSNLV